MAIKLHKAGYNHAVSLINNGLEVEHDHNNWEQVKPTDNEIAYYLNHHSLESYGQWFLGVDTDITDNSKEKYLYPYGDLKIVHKSALQIAEQEAAAHNHSDIEDAAQELLDML